MNLIDVKIRYKNLIDHLVIICDKIIDAVAKSHNDTTKTVLIDCNDEKATYRVGQKKGA